MAKGLKGVIFLFALAAPHTACSAEIGATHNQDVADAGNEPAHDAALDATRIPEPGEGASCVGLRDNCGADSKEDCCTSLLVPGGTFYRSYDGVIYTDPSYPATVSDFRLDKYEVTAARFNKFLAAWNSGWRPSEGAGKHTHLNGGSGLSNSAEPGFETGWEPTWAEYVSADTGVGLDTYPIWQINWYEAYAFCIWDGGFLSSEAEWNYAATGGSEQRVYPWSVPPSATLLDETHLVVCYQDNGFLVPACGSPLPVESRPAGNGRWGHTDLIGNVEEWTLDGLPMGAEMAWEATPGFVYPYEPECSDCSYLPLDTSLRILRGGDHTTLDPTHSPSYRWRADPTIRVPGARCARPPN